MIHISFETIDKPWGGANQFLKGLKNEFKKLGKYTDDPNKAEIILFNSHHNTEIIKKLKKDLPSKVKFFHRVDGPMKLYNNDSDPRDLVVSHLNSEVADATIFQSGWSMHNCFQENLFTKQKPYMVIPNACDPNIFYPKDEKNEAGKPCKLISTSFSSNPKKGFAFYKRAEEKFIDFEEYDYTFLGRNTAVIFDNIKELGELASADVAEALRNSDIYITASENDPCSNSLIEAISCGLPCLAYNSGGHPEILENTNGGLVFNNLDDFKTKLQDIKLNYKMYRNAIKPFTMSDIANKYLNFLYWK